MLNKYLINKHMFLKINQYGGQKSVAGGNDELIILLIDSAEVGACDLEIDNKIGFISNVKIYELYQGKGYCEKLIKKVIEIAIVKKLVKIELHVKNDNIPAIKCYTKCGFKIIRNNLDDDGNLFGYTMELLL